MGCVVAGRARAAAEVVAHTAAGVAGTAGPPASGEPPAAATAETPAPAAEVAEQPTAVDRRILSPPPPTVLTEPSAAEASPRLRSAFLSPLAADALGDDRPRADELVEDRVVDLCGGHRLGLLTAEQRGDGSEGLLVTGALTAVITDDGVQARSPAWAAGLGKLVGWRLTHLEPEGKAWVRADSEGVLRRACAAGGRLRLRFRITVSRQDQLVAGARIWRSWQRRKQAAARSSLEGLVFRLLLRQVELIDERELNDSAVDFDVLPDVAAPPPATGPWELPTRRLESVVKHLRKSHELPPREDAEAVVRQLRLWYERQPAVVRVPLPREGNGRVYVVGDLHGQLDDLLYILDRFGPAGGSTGVQYIFNGDFVDRGRESVEIVILLFALKLLVPASIHLTRGNHEDERANVRYGFHTECCSKYGLPFFQLCVWAFQSLPLCHIVDGSVAVVHGGLPEYDDFMVDEVEGIDRFRGVPKGGLDLPRQDRIFQSLLWSDPRELEGCADGWEPSRRGAGVHFGRALTEAFLMNNGLDYLLRSHQVVDKGCKPHHDGLLLTVFSASHYMEKDDNQGSVVEVTRPRRGEPIAVRPTQWSGTDKSDHQRRDAVRGLRVGGTIAGDARFEVLRVVRGLVFANKMALLESFATRDSADTGVLCVHDWAEVMENVIGTGVAWRFLLPYLVTDHDDAQATGLRSIRTGKAERARPCGCMHENGVAYYVFLERFQNTLTVRFLHDWCSAVLPHLRPRIARCAAALGQLGKTRLSYFELHQLLQRGYLPLLEPRLLQYLVVALDQNSDGYIDAAEFAEANKEEGDGDAHQLLLWELWRLGSAGGWAELRSGFREAEAAGGASGVASSDFVSLCVRCFAASAALRDVPGATDASTWKAAAAALDGRRTGRVRWKTLQRCVQSFGAFERQAVMVTELIETIARARVQLSRVCLAMDRDGDGTITDRELRSGLSKLLSGSPQQSVLHVCWLSLWTLIDANGDGWVSYSELMTALEVRDVYLQPELLDPGETWNATLSMRLEKVVPGRPAERSPKRKKGKKKKAKQKKEKSPVSPVRKGKRRRKAAKQPRSGS